MSAERLASAVSEAREIAALLAPWEERTSFALRRERLETLALRGLRWQPPSAACRALMGALEALALEVPGDLDLAGAEAVLLLERALRGAETEGLGGAGGGVAVLSVTEARAHTFDHLFLLGVNRDVFPRRVSEDPLLPDALRRALEAVLPHVPRKQRGFDEERYLFAQLCAASPRVTLSWQGVSEDGRARTPSPFIERLRLAGRVAEPLPGLLSDAEAAPRLRPAFEHALLAGLHGSEPEREASYAAARDEARRELGASGAPPAATLARTRGAVRREWEGAPGSRVLGPYLGLVGPPGGVGSPSPRSLRHRSSKGWPAARGATSSRSSSASSPFPTPSAGFRAPIRCCSAAQCTAPSRPSCARGPASPRRRSSAAALGREARTARLARARGGGAPRARSRGGGAPGGGHRAARLCGAPSRDRSAPRSSAPASSSGRRRASSRPRRSALP